MMRMPDILFHEAGIQMAYGDAQVNVTGRFEYDIFDGRPTYVNGTRLTFFVPYEGDGELFQCKPSTFNYNPPRADVREGELIFTYERTTSEMGGIEDEFKRHLKDTQ